jgi:hypothetical protein
MGGTPWRQCKDLAQHPTEQEQHRLLHLAIPLPQNTVRGTLPQHLTACARRNCFCGSARACTPSLSPSPSPSPSLPPCVSCCRLLTPLPAFPAAASSRRHCLCACAGRSDLLVRFMTFTPLPAFPAAASSRRDCLCVCAGQSDLLVRFTFRPHASLTRAVARAHTESRVSTT